MKTFVATICLSGALSTAFAQGLVNFFNPFFNFVTTGPAQQETPIPGPPETYYFALLIAVPGTTDRSQFAFTGLYATNLATGRFLGGTRVSVPGWLPGTTESFLIAGWSATLGHDWNSEWQSGVFNVGGYFGESSIGTGLAGGFGEQTSPPLILFQGPNSPTGIQTGWNLAPVNPVPEPLPLSLIIGGTVILLGAKKSHRSAEPRLNCSRSLQVFNSTLPSRS